MRRTVLGVVVGLAACSSLGTSGGDLGDAGAAVDLSSSIGSRLFLAAAPDGIAVWRDPHLAVADRAADLVVADPSVAKAAAVAVHGSRLFVATDGLAPELVGFDGAGELTTSQAPVLRIPRASFGVSSGSVGERLVSMGPDVLWAISSFNGVFEFPGASTLTSSSAPQALFTHAFQQTPDAVYLPSEQRLFVGQISGAGLLAWNNPLSLNGSPTADFSISASSVWHLATIGGRIYGAGLFGTASPRVLGVGVWTSVPSSPAAATFILSTGFTVNNDFIADVGVFGDTLVASAYGTSNRVHVWTNASTLSADTPATAIVSLTDNPIRAYLSTSGRLYVLDTKGVAIYDNVPAAPAFVTRLSGMGHVTSAYDMFVAE
jgi:hypothetical protein